MWALGLDPAISESIVIVPAHGVIILQQTEQWLNICMPSEMSGKSVPATFCHLNSFYIQIKMQIYDELNNNKY